MIKTTSKSLQGQNWFMFPKHIKAFTLIEIISVMLLTALFSSLAFYSYQLIRQQYTMFKKRNDQLEEYFRFSSIILEDTYSCKKLINKFGTLKFDDGISFTFEDSMVIKQNDDIKLLPDTFFVDAKLMNALFESKPINAGLIDECMIMVNFFGKIHIIHLTKSYSATELINHKK